MARDSSLVQRLISFLKKPDALEYDNRRHGHNPYDDYQASPVYQEPAPPPAPDMRFVSAVGRSPNDASRLDALVMRALQQFSAHHGYVIRYEPDGRMQYCTGRDYRGRYIAHTEADPDRRAMFLALDSGESQFFVYTQGQTPISVLCGPLVANNEIMGVLYIDNPASNRLHRGVFEIFCDQAARMLSMGMA